MARIIHEVRPRYAFVENSPMLTSRGLGTVLGDLASMGFDARWGVLGAADVGANHQRDRIWIVAKWRGHVPHTQHNRIGWREQQQEGVEKTAGEVADTRQIGLRDETTNCQMEGNIGFSLGGMDRDWWAREPESVPRTIKRDMGGVVDGMAARVDRIKALGNGQVPLCAAEAWNLLNNFGG